MNDFNIARLPHSGVWTSNPTREQYAAESRAAFDAGDHPAAMRFAAIARRLTWIPSRGD